MRGDGGERGVSQSVSRSVGQSVGQSVNRKSSRSFAFPPKIRPFLCTSPACCTNLFVPRCSCASKGVVVHHCRVDAPRTPPSLGGSQQTRGLCLCFMPDSENACSCCSPRPEPQRQYFAACPPCTVPAPYSADEFTRGWRHQASHADATELRGDIKPRKPAREAVGCGDSRIPSAAATVVGIGVVVVATDGLNALECDHCRHLHLAAAEPRPGKEKPEYAPGLHRNGTSARRPQDAQRPRNIFVANHGFGRRPCRMRLLP